MHYYLAMQADDGLWYINEYWKDIYGITRRETLYNDMPEHIANDMVRRLNYCRDYLHNPRVIAA